MVEEEAVVDESCDVAEDGGRWGSSVCKFFVEGWLEKEGLRLERRERLYVLTVKRREWDGIGWATAAVELTAGLEMLKEARDLRVLWASS